MRSKFFQLLVWDDRPTLVLSILLLAGLAWKEAWTAIVIFGNFSILAHMILFALKRSIDVEEKK